MGLETGGGCLLQVLSWPVLRQDPLQSPGPGTDAAVGQGEGWQLRPGVLVGRSAGTPRQRLAEKMCAHCRPLPWPGSSQAPPRESPSLIGDPNGSFRKFLSVKCHSFMPYCSQGSHVLILTLKK